MAAMVLVESEKEVGHIKSKTKMFFIVLARLPIGKKQENKYKKHKIKQINKNIQV